MSQPSITVSASALPKPLPIPSAPNCYIRAIRYLSDKEVKAKLAVVSSTVEVGDMEQTVVQMRALGYSVPEIARHLGKTHLTISRLIASPAIQDRIAVETNRQSNWREQMLHVLQGTIELGIGEIRHRLMTNPDSVETKDLINVLHLALNRTGFNDKKELDIKVESRSSIAMLKATIDQGLRNGTIINDTSANTSPSQYQVLPQGEASGDDYQSSVPA